MITSILLGLTILAFGAYIYKHPPKTTAIPPSRNSICMDYSKEPISKLELDLIHNMVTGYKNNQLDTIVSNSLTMDYDAHSIWFELETLKKFIYHIEFKTNEAKKTMTTEAKNKLGKLGVRMYYSRYPDEVGPNQYPDLSAVPLSDYRRLHTLIMIPTLERDGAHMDFDPTDKDSYNLSKEQIKKYFTSKPNTRVPALGILENSQSQTSRIVSQNHGSLIPPADNSVEGFFNS